MTNLKKQFDTTNLDELCKFLTQEITQLATSDYKLKLMFVLAHIIEESQKALADINTDNLVTELYNRVKAACEKSEKQKEILQERFSIDKKTMANLVDGTNDEFEALHDEIENKLKQLNILTKQLAHIRENMSPEEVKRSKQK